MTHEWPPIPGKTVLTVQRELRTGEQEQWAVVPGKGGLAVHSAKRDAHGPWRQGQVTTADSDLAEVLRRFPDMTTLAKGAATTYTVDEVVMEPPILASMLTADQAGGPENPDDWHGEDDQELAQEWAESDENLSSWAIGYTWFPRWAKINDVRVSVLQADIDGSAITQPVLFDDDEGQFIPVEEIASEFWFSEGGGAPISWAGGHTLSELAPGLGYSQPTRDSREIESYADPLCVLPQAPESLGEFLADWVLKHDAEVAAALELEPFDPDERLTAAERAEWDSRLNGDVPVSFDVYVCEDTLRSLRKTLRNRSERYRQTMEGLRNPSEPEGQALADALDAAYGGYTAHLIRGDW